MATTARVTSGGTSGTATSSKTSVRYGSSLITTIGWPVRASIASISTYVEVGYTTPLGLLGEFRMIARVRGVIAASRRATSGVRSAFGGTTISRPP